MSKGYGSSSVGEEAPNGLYSGTRAITVQSYTEANAKNGSEHEASVYLTAVAAGANNDTIFQVGSLPVSIKARVVSYTGAGVEGNIFEAPSYTGGTPLALYNATSINPIASLSSVLEGATVTVNGTQAFASTHSIGNTSNQGQGSTGSVLGSEKILKPNTDYLFRLTSLDTQPEDISSFVSWYEGELDLPL